MKNLLLLMIGLLPLVALSALPNHSDSEQKTTIKDSLLNDADVIWMAEIYTNYATDFDSKNATIEQKKMMSLFDIKQLNSVQILKLQSSYIASNNYAYDHRLINKLIASSKHLKHYKEDNLKEIYSPEELKERLIVRDTFISFDPETYEQIVERTALPINLLQVKAFRIKQLLYYNKKDMVFRTVPIAIAPLFVSYTKANTIKSITELFWMDINRINYMPDLNSPNITWAKRMVRSIPIKHLRVIKKELSINETLDKMMADYRANANRILVYDGVDKNKKLSEKEVSRIGKGLDTIMTFDPETLEKIIEVVDISIKGVSINSLNIMQDWIWDEKNKKFSIRLVNFTPVIYEYDYNGKLKRTKELFVRPVNDAK